MRSRFLTSTDEEERSPVGTIGRPLPSYFAQLKAYVAEHLGEQTAGYFAEPVRDSVAGQTDWFCNGNGEPHKLSDLSRTDRIQIIQTLADHQAQLTAFASQTPAQGSEDLHRILGLALSEPSMDDVYAVDGQPVVTNWGYEPPLAFVPIENPAADKAPKQTLPRRELGMDRPFMSQKDFRIGQLHVSVLTLCMIGAMAFALASGTLRTLGVAGGQATDPLIAGQSIADPSELRRAQADNEKLRLEIEVMQDNLMKRALSCLNECLSKPIPKPEPTPAPPGPEELIIPEESKENGDVSFLEGIWRSETGLFLKGDKTPLTVTYNVKADGSGRRTIKLNDGRECTGSFQASFDSKKNLQIVELDTAECDDGETIIIPYTVTCTTKASGKANCVMKSEESSKDVIAVLRRVK